MNSQPLLDTVARLKAVADLYKELADASTAGVNQWKSLAADDQITYDIFSSYNFEF